MAFGQATSLIVVERRSPAQLLAENPVPLAKMDPGLMASH
jgi:hypothetical protein